MAARLFLPKGKTSVVEFQVQSEYVNYCAKLRKEYGEPVFKMDWPNKKVFHVFRDKKDNQIEVVFIPTTIGGFA